MNPTSDQTDILAANERLILERDEAQRSLAEAQASIATLTTERDTAARERDEARAQLATITAERDQLAGVDRDFNRRLAAEVARHGIRPEAIAPASKAPSSTDLLARYEAITDPREKAAFLSQHEKELRALVR